MQRYLVYLGFDVGPVDGLMGVRTQAAIQSYQRTRSLKPDGLVSERLLNHMAIAIDRPAAEKAASAVAPTPSPTAAADDQSKLVERTQFYLRVIGLFEGDNDGTPSVELEQSVMRFQNANRISVDGKITSELVGRIKAKLYE